MFSCVLPQWMYRFSVQHIFIQIFSNKILCSIIIIRDCHLTLRPQEVTVDFLKKLLLNHPKFKEILLDISPPSDYFFIRLQLP